VVERRDVGGEGLHAQAVMVSGHRAIYVSGQVAADAEGRAIGDDVGTQARVVFERIAAHLAELGATMDDVVKITTFLTDMNEYAPFSAVRAEFFPRRKPASSTVGVKALSHADFLIEIEAVAAVDAG
jgi:enamine deaminase RidA (YjgF/YER057c/UK114 family)